MLWVIDQGADVHAKNMGGETPLHRAYGNGNAEVVEALLEKGADVHAENSDGDTPLYNARWYDHHDIAAMLHAKSAVR
jgi:ankyrin repeat protein